MRSARKIDLATAISCTLLLMAMSTAAQRTGARDQSTTAAAVKEKATRPLGPKKTAPALYPVRVPVKDKDGKPAGKKWGFIDRAGKMIIKPQFDGVDVFSEGLARVNIGGKGGGETFRREDLPKDGKWGYIGPTGRLVIKPQYELGGSFKEGMAAVIRADEFWTYIDRSGREIKTDERTRLALHRTYARQFWEGLVPVPGDGWGYVDKKGKWAIEDNKDIAFAMPFSEGLGCVNVGGESLGGVRGVKGGKFGFIDRTGKMVIKPQFGTAFPFREGLAWVNVGGKCISWTTRGGKWGCIDKTGKMVIKPQFVMTCASAFYEGRAAIKVGGRVDEKGRVVGGKWGFINKTGKVVVKPEYAGFRRFSEGLAAVNVGDKTDKPRRHMGGKWGFIDRVGKMIIKPQFDDVEGFRNGLVYVKVADGWGYIDKTGKWIWKPPQR